jgi:phage terminase large subunit
MEINLNSKFKPLFNSKTRYIICIGGRGTGRSFASSQYALVNLVGSKYFRCAIMRFVLGDIRNSIYQEIRDRIDEKEEEGELPKDSIRIRENILSFDYGQNRINGIGFRKSSSDQKSKLKSLASYNCIIIEEADEVAEEDFTQLDDSIRTAKGDIRIILLLNPPDKNHWIIKRWFNLIPSGIEGFYDYELKKSVDDVSFIGGTYLNNIQNLNKKTIDNYERYKQINPDHYYNMIRGLVSEGARGRIFKNWKIITNDEFNQLPYESYFGLDFGYSNDEASLVEVKEHNNNIWVKELIYEVGLTNKDLSVRFEQLGLKKGESVIYADSAEPKSIEELKRDGWHVMPSIKGADSIRSGIDYMLGKVIHYTEESNNIAIETQNYKWALDKNKEPTNKPKDEYNNAIDSIRYAVVTNSKKVDIDII